MSNTTGRLLSIGALSLLLSACGTGAGARDGSSATALKQIQVTPPTASVAAGLRQQLVATAIYQDGHTQDVTGQVTWSSSDPGVASVDAAGLVSSAAVGRAQVVASLEGRSSSSLLAVSAATLVSLELVSASGSVPVGLSASVSARGHFSDGSDVDLTSQSRWSVPAGGLTVVLPGQVRGSAEGPAQLCASFRGVQAVLDVEVTSAAAVALAITASRDLAALPRGAQARLAVSATFSDETEHELDDEVTWTTSPSAVARVVDGRLVGLAVGSTLLTASYHGRTGSVQVTVTGAELLGFSISPPAPTVPLLGFVHLSALGRYSDGAEVDLTEEVTWTSQYADRVQLSNRAGEAGNAYGLVAGAGSVVTAELPGTDLSATAYVQVEGAD